MNKAWFIKNKLIIIIFLAALIARLLMLGYAYFVNGPQFVDPVIHSDQSEYARVGVNIFSHGNFSLDGLNERHQILANSIRTPLFPLFLGAGYALSGGFILSILLNCLLGALTAVFVFQIALLILKRPRYALAAALIYSFLPYVVFLSSFAMADTFFSFIFSYFILYFLRLLTGHYKWSKTRLAGLGIILGLAVLTRPIVQFFIVVPILSLAIVWGRHYKNTLVYAATVLIFFTATIAPWLARNRFEFGEFFLSSLGRYHMYVSYYIPWQAYREQVPRVDKEKTANEYVLAKYGQDIMKDVIYDYKISTALGLEATAAIERDPVSYGLFHLSGLPSYFFNNDFFATLREAFFIKLPDMRLVQKITLKDYKGLFGIVAGSNFGFLLLLAVTYAFLFLKTFLGIFGAAHYIRRHRAIGVFMLATIMYFPLMIGPEGHARFRVPTESLLVIFSIYSLLLLFRFIKDRKLTKPV